MFAVIFFIIALIASFVHYRLRGPHTRARLIELLLVYQLAITIGFGGVFGALAHLFAPKYTADQIGWATSPFQRENAFGDLGIGVLGILCTWLRGNFWNATVIMASISLLGDAYGHIYELVVNHNHHPDNSGAILYMDIIAPLVAIGLLLAWRRLQETQPATTQQPPARQQRVERGNRVYGSRPR